MSEREILFRGKRSNGEWIEGVAFPHDNGMCTMFYQHPMDGSLEGREVILETVGEYTGLTDKNGTRIFEGDIVEYGGKRYVFKFLEKYARYAPTKPNTVFAFFNFAECEVIGNIHDNPELLKGERK